MPINETLCGKYVLFAAQGMFQKSHIKIDVVVTQAIFYFCIMDLFQGDNAVEKIDHRITTATGPNVA